MGHFKYIFNHLLYKFKKIILTLIVSNDSKFVIVKDDLVSNEILLKGFHEKYELNLILNILKKFLPNKSSMIDVGANIGNHSVFFGPHFKKVYSFEPNPILFKVLQSNIMLNKLDKNIELFNIGLGDKNENKKYLLTTKNLGGSGFFEKNFNSKYHHSEFDLEIIKGDSFNLKNINFLKIDTEGYDFKVIKGLRETIKKCKPIITFEVHPFGKDADELLNYLKELKYIYLYNISASMFSPPTLKEISFFEKGKLYTSIIASTYNLKNYDLKENVDH